MSTSTPPPPDDRPPDPPPPPPPGGPPPGWNQHTYPPQARGAASVGKRVGAFIIDAILVGVVMVPIFVFVGITAAVSGPPVGGMDYPGSFLWGLLSTAVFLAYFTLMEGSRGQTVGKMLLGTKVVGVGGAADYAAAFKRRLPFVVGNLIPVPFLGSLVGLGLVIAVLVTTASDAENRGFHDRWAGTAVLET